MRTHRCAFAILMVILGVHAQDNKIYKMCVTENQATTSDCNILKRAESTFNCVNVIDSTDCALKLERGEADFGIFTADEAILMSKFDNNQQRKVIAEIRENDRENEKYKFETVAIVKNTFAGPLSNLKGKNFCHPGFSKNQMWSDRVLKHFERVVVNRSLVCDKTSRTAAESELYALSSFFGKACRPGQWIPSEFSTLEKKFKQRYNNLCALCDSFNGCSYNPQADGNQYSALDCLTKKGGDVAYVSLYYAERYFGKVGAQQRSNINSGDYQFLCPNGTTQPLPSTRNPCTWIAQPWDSIVARNDEIANTLIIELRKRLPTEQLKRSNEWVDTLFKVILGEDVDRLFIEKNIYTLRNFIQEGREIPQPGTTVPCEHSMKWCTTSTKENEKCEWLQQAGVTQGIVPEIECVQGTSKLNCFEKIKNNEADVIGIDTNLGTIASHYYNLTTSLYQETEGKFRVIAVVKNELTAGSFRDLKNKKACFPEFGGLAWAAFVNEIDELKDEFCPFDNSMGKFFNQVCAPGANRRLDNNNSTEQNKFCKLCANAFSGNQSIWAPFSKPDSCEVTSRNQFYGDVGALRCLGTGVADFAIINSYNLSVNLEDDKLPTNFANKYSIMCKNGSKVSLSTQLDDDCAIISVTGGEVVTRRSITTAESRDLKITLQQYADCFGYFSGHNANFFRLFEPFDGYRDLLIRHETLDFVTPAGAGDEHYKSMQDYAKLKNDAETCAQERSEPDGAPSIEVQALTIFLVLFSTLVHILVMF